MTIIWCMVPETPSATDRIFCHSRTVFALLPPNKPKNQNFEKMKKYNWRYYHFTNVYHKWQSYDVRFLRYRTRQTEFFVILGHILPFYPPKGLKNQNLKKWKRYREILSFYTSLPEIMIICYTVPEIWCATDGRIDRRTERVTHRGGCPT